jgi:hypothetical protein
MDSSEALNKIQLRRSIAIVRPIFHAREVFGRNQIRGKAIGPIHATAMIMKDFLKYQGNFSSAGRAG